MFVTSNLQTMYHMWHAGMFMVYIYTKIHTPSPTGCRFIRLKAKNIFARLPCSYLIFYKKKISEQTCILSYIFYHTSFQGPILCGARFSPLSEIKHYAMKAYGRVDPRVLVLGTSWRWVVSFTPRPLYLQRKSPRYPLDRRLGGRKLKQSAYAI
jgi:hypothetical protein